MGRRGGGKFAAAIHPGHPMEALSAVIFWTWLFTN
jgi:hypothetical protein